MYCLQLKPYFKVICKFLYLFNFYINFYIDFIRINYVLGISGHVVTQSSATIWNWPAFINSMHAGCRLVHMLDQWRNVTSGGPRFKIFEGPPSRIAKGTSWAPYMHEFSRGSRACSSGKFLNMHSLKCHFLDFGERFYRILMVRKRHCNISEALANVFALSPKPGGPHLAHW
jgi:hypothetical protein